MNTSDIEKKEFVQTVQHIVRPLVTVDVAIFTLGGSAHGQQHLQVLLVQRPADAAEPFAGQWALPGGFVDVAQDEDLRACALRKLQQKTGVQSPYLEQLGSWGGRTRDPRGWSTTHVYFALLPFEALAPRTGGNAQELGWFAVADSVDVDMDVDGAAGAAGVQGAGVLAFDHAQILAKAVERLRSKVEYTSLPAFLLPEPFTLPQLQRAYEVVLGRPLDKSSFRTRALAMKFLQETGPMLHLDVPRKPEGYCLKNRDEPVVFPRPLQAR